MYTYTHPRPSLTVDVLLLGAHAQQPVVLLIRRRHPPFAGQWALPGGFVDMDEPLEAAARRELAEETGLDRPNLALRQLGTYGDPDRDPRGRTVSVVYAARLDAATTAAAAVQGADDATEAQWVPLDEALAAELAFDHVQILRDGLQYFNMELA